MSLISRASRRMSIENFIKDAKKGESLKYKAEAGKTHLIYFPYEEVEVEENGEVKKIKSLIALSGKLHDWETCAGKYSSTICTAGIVEKDEEGNIINDGSCAICDRVSDAWDIVNYRMALAESKTDLVGKEREKYLESCKDTYMDSRKARDAREYLYMLVVVFETDKKGNVILDDDDEPEYSLKVMRLSGTRAEKIQTQLDNSGVEMPGAEIKIQYPDEENKMLVVSGSSISAVFPDKYVNKKYLGKLTKMQEEIDNFEFEGLEKYFKEWEGMTTVQTQITVEKLFADWDEFQERLKTNPNDARYLEYSSNTSSIKVDKELDKESNNVDNIQKGEEKPKLGSTLDPNSAFKDTDKI